MSATDPRQALIDALRATEIKWAGLTDHDSEAAEQAKQIICSRLKESAGAPDVGEFRYTMPDRWSEFLFRALLKRYGLAAYRYEGQRKTTIMVRASRGFIDGVLSPIFFEMSGRLQSYFYDLTLTAVPAALAPGPYNITILPNHHHAGGQLCPDCARKLANPHG